MSPVRATHCIKLQMELEKFLETVWELELQCFALHKKVIILKNQLIEEETLED